MAVGEPLLSKPKNAETDPSENFAFETHISSSPALFVQPVKTKQTLRDIIPDRRASCCNYGNTSSKCFPQCLTSGTPVPNPPRRRRPCERRLSHARSWRNPHFSLLQGKPNGSSSVSKSHRRKQSTGIKPPRNKRSCFDAYTRRTMQACLVKGSPGQRMEGVTPSSGGHQGRKKDTALTVRRARRRVHVPLSDARP